MIYNKHYLVLCLLTLASSKVSSEKIPCDYTFDGNVANIFCPANNALPGSNCTWIYETPSSRSLWHSFPSTERWRNTKETTCTTSIKEPGAGTHIFILSIASKTGGDDKEFGHVQFTIEAPRNSPKFKTRNGVIQAYELFLNDDEDVRLECHQYDGVPSVYNISIVCDMSKTYEQYSGYTEGNHSIWIKVNRTWDQTTCTCYTHHISSPNPFKKPMKIFVISPPKELTCDYTFPGATTAQVTCTTTRVYPKAECITHFRNPTSSQIVQQSSAHQPANETGYFTSKSLSSFVLTNQLNYDVDVEMYPYVHNYNTYKTPAMKSACISVILEPPSHPPRFTLLNGSDIYKELTVRDNDNITVRCQVNGGKPVVMRTQIECNGSRSTSKGQSANLSIHVNKGMHRNICKCSAQHVSEKYSVTSSFFLYVQAPAVIDSLQFHPISGNVTNKYTPGSRLTLWCNVTGNPKPKIDLIYKKGGYQLHHETSEEIIRFYFKHSMTATCNNTGAYRCSVSNPLNTIGSSQEIELNVNCRIHHCNSSDDLPSFGVPVGEDVHISLCVIAYQTPIEITLHAGNGSAEVDTRNYNVRFTETDKKLSRGMVNVTMYSLAVNDLGMYSLRVTLPPYGPINNSILNFKLDANGRPLCPYNSMLIKQSEDNAILIWIPGFNGGLPQTFVIGLSTPSSSPPSPGLDDGVVVVAHVPQTKTDIMAYNLTGLSNWTQSVVYIQPENALGASKCPEAKTTLTKSGSRDMLLSVTIYSAASSILTVLLLGVLILARHKSKSRNLFDANKMCCWWSSCQKYGNPSTGDHESAYENDGNYSMQCVYGSGETTTVSTNEYDFADDDNDDNPCRVEQITPRHLQLPLLTQRQINSTLKPPEPDSSNDMELSDLEEENTKRKDFTQQPAIPRPHNSTSFSKGITNVTEIETRVKTVDIITSSERPIKTRTVSRATCYGVLGSSEEVHHYGLPLNKESEIPVKETLDGSKWDKKDSRQSVPASISLASGGSLDSVMTNAYITPIDEENCGSLKSVMTSDYRTPIDGDSA